MYFFLQHCQYYQSNLQGWQRALDEDLITIICSSCRRRRELRVAEIILIHVCLVASMSPEVYFCLCAVVCAPVSTGAACLSLSVSVALPPSLSVSWHLAPFRFSSYKIRCGLLSTGFHSSIPGLVTLMPRFH